MVFFKERNGVNTKNSFKTTAPEARINSAIKILAYPNPSTTEFSLSLSGFNEGNVSIKVTDYLGRQVFQAEGSSNRVYRFGKNFIAGIFIVQVIQGDKKLSTRVIKE